MFQNIDLIEFGQRIMDELDKQGIEHSYYSVGMYGIELAIYPKVADVKITFHVALFPLTDATEKARILMPLVSFVSQDLKRWQSAHRDNPTPEWAAYLGMCEWRS